MAAGPAGAEGWVVGLLAVQETELRLSLESHWHEGLSHIAHLAAVSREEAAGRARIVAEGLSGILDVALEETLLRSLQFVSRVESRVRLEANLCPELLIEWAHGCRNIGENAWMERDELLARAAIDAEEIVAWRRVRVERSRFSAVRVLLAWSCDAMALHQDRCRMCLLRVGSDVLMGMDALFRLELSWQWLDGLRGIRALARADAVDVGEAVWRRESAEMEEFQRKALEGSVTLLTEHISTIYALRVEQADEMAELATSHALWAEVSLGRDHPSVVNAWSTAVEQWEVAGAPSRMDVRALSQFSARLAREELQHRQKLVELDEKAERRRVEDLEEEERRSTLAELAFWVKAERESEAFAMEVLSYACAGGGDMAEYTQSVCLGEAGKVRRAAYERAVGCIVEDEQHGRCVLEGKEGRCWKGVTLQWGTGPPPPRAPRGEALKLTGLPAMLRAETGGWLPPRAHLPQPTSAPSAS